MTFTTAGPSLSPHGRGNPTRGTPPPSHWIIAVFPSGCFRVLKALSSPFSLNLSIVLFVRAYTWENSRLTVLCVSRVARVPVGSEIRVLVRLLRCFWLGMSTPEVDCLPRMESCISFGDNRWRDYILSTRFVSVQSCL